ncbi:MAG: aspartate aminotransferase [Ignavibacteriae bacterium HGW-Ignavibacteriae-2]|jgi:aspartate aminotransferase|nr:aminotransferase class I/II-fold pyridoxal phosphate-dependent enzyme [Bacteroidota bacterium]PKL88662.1 MAG: aspartate aminotransferase [Ignavibacteriae bacterium HGW-Ignavibacteriae-2]
MQNNSNHVQVNLNLNVRGIPQSATIRINELSEELKNQGKVVHKFGLGQSPFPVPEPVVEALRLNAYQKDYLPTKGLKALRESVSEYFYRKQGVAYTWEDVLIGPGSKELMFLLQLVYYGDLIIPTPSWVSYAPQAHIIGRHVGWIPTRKENCWRLTPDQLDKYCKDDPERPRILILNYPSNPSGCSFNKKELEALASVAKKYKIILLSDEIYGELDHEGNHISISRFYPEGTIVSSGLSKWCGAGGWRLGIFIFPDSMRWLLNAMTAVASETFTSTSAPIQFAAVRAFKGGIEIERYLSQSRRILKVIGMEIYRKLSKAGVTLPVPTGGFYLFADFSKFKKQLLKKEIYTSQQFCTKLLEDTGVAILPGTVFGRPEEEYTARIAYVDFDGANALAHAEFIPMDKNLNEKFLQDCCGRIIEATDKIILWLNNL